MFRLRQARLVPGRSPVRAGIAVLALVAAVVGPVVGATSAQAAPLYTNVVDPDTSTIEGSVGHWVPWYSTGVSQAPAPTGGTKSLKVDINAANGWGVQLDNFPGFATSPGAHVIGFWGRSDNAGLAATMTVTWSTSGGPLSNPYPATGTDTVTLPLTGTLTHAATVAFAPPGTQFARITFTSATGTAADAVYLDDISVTRVPSALGADTTTLEGGKGQWAPWYSTNISRSTAQAHGGTSSLKVDITNPYGWGIQQRNIPVSSTGVGAHVIGFWGRSASPGLTATMEVTWRNPSGAVGSDTVTLPLTNAWTHVSALVFAPPGTESADVHISNATGQPGDTLFLDDITVIGVPSIVGPDTATIEGPGYRWVPWYSTSVSQSTAQAHRGAHSLKVDITAPYGWGVQLGTFPAFATTPGPKTIGFWARSPSAGLAATMTVHWRTGSGMEVGVDQLSLALSNSWTQALAEVIAPAGTTRVTVELSNPAGGPGDTLYLDDIVVVDSTIAVLTPG